MTLKFNKYSIVKETLNAKIEGGDGMWKFAAFDWDGTLCNTREDGYSAVKHIFKTFDKLTPTMEKYISGVFSDFMRFYYDYGIPKSVSKYDLSALWLEYFRLRGNTKLNEGSLELIATCCNLGLKAVIVSANPNDIRQELLKANFPTKLFSAIIFDAQDKRKALLRILCDFGVYPCEAFYCDDSYDGILAAKSLGMSAIGVSMGFNAHNKIIAAHPDYPKNGKPIMSLWEVKEIVEKECQNNYRDG